MSILRFFYAPKFSTRKIWDIKQNLFLLVSQYTDEKISIQYFGAYWIHPKNLAFWICVTSDETKITLQKNQELKDKITTILKESAYPAEAVGKIFVDFESQETVDRESNGNWYVHLK